MKKKLLYVAPLATPLDIRLETSILSAESTTVGGPDLDDPVSSDPW